MKATVCWRGYRISIAIGEIALFEEACVRESLATLLHADDDSRHLLLSHAGATMLRCIQNDSWNCVETR